MCAIERKRSFQSFLYSQSYEAKPVSRHQTDFPDGKQKNLFLYSVVVCTDSRHEWKPFPLLPSRSLGLPWLSAWHPQSLGGNFLPDPRNRYQPRLFS